jgi:hypothetical protein
MKAKRTTGSAMPAGAARLPDVGATARDRLRDPGRRPPGTSGTACEPSCLLLAQRLDPGRPARLWMRAHGTEVPANAAARSARVRREKPRRQQCSDGGPMGTQVAAGGKIRVQRAFQEREGPGEPGCLGEIGELLPGECRHHDPFTVRGGEVAGEAALSAVADLTSCALAGWASARKARWPAMVRAASCATAGSAGLPVMSRGRAGLARHLRWP